MLAWIHLFFIALLFALSSTALAAPAKAPPGAKPAPKKAAKPVPHGKLIRLIPTRVVIHYTFKDKKTGKLYPLTTTSKPLVLKVIKPTKPIKPTQGRKRLDKTPRKG